MVIFFGYETALRYWRTIDRLDTRKISRSKPSATKTVTSDELNCALKELAELGINLYPDPKADTNNKGSINSKASAGNKSATSNAKSGSNEFGTWNNVRILSNALGANNKAHTRNNDCDTRDEGRASSKRDLNKAEDPSTKVATSDKLVSSSKSLTACFELTAKNCEAFASQQPVLRQRPLHLIAASKETRAQINNIVSHVWTAPANKSSFIRVSEQVQISSPEACFL